jgi:glucosamine-6-phosphate deaminase
MKLTVCRDRDEAAAQVADLLVGAVRKDPHLRLGLSAGSTSLIAYSEVVRRFHQDGGFSFRWVSTFNTDEYVGLKPNDPRSTRFLMNSSLFWQIDLPLCQTHVPRGDSRDLDAECQAYDLLIQARGGINLVVLGLGHNGHVGLNEPGSSPKSRTRLVDLTPSTLAAISGGERFKHLDETPGQAVAMGMATILESERVILVATGVGKADALQKMLEGRPGPTHPASLLIGHKNLVVIADRDAAMKLAPKTVEKLA